MIKYDNARFFRVKLFLLHIRKCEIRAYLPTPCNLDPDPFTFSVSLKWQRSWPVPLSSVRLISFEVENR